MRDMIDTRLAMLELFGEADVKNVQEQVKHGDYSWFINYHDKLLD